MVLRDGRRVKLVGPPGTGKTWVQLELIRRIQSTLGTNAAILVICPYNTHVKLDRRKNAAPPRPLHSVRWKRAQVQLEASAAAEAACSRAAAKAAAAGPADVWRKAWTAAAVALSTATMAPMF